MGECAESNRNLWHWAVVAIAMLGPSVVALLATHLCRAEDATPSCLSSGGCAAGVHGCGGGGK